MHNVLLMQKLVLNSSIVLFFIWYLYYVFQFLLHVNDDFGGKYYCVFKL